MVTVTVIDCRVASRYYIQSGTILLMSRVKYTNSNFFLMTVGDNLFVSLCV